MTDARDDYDDLGPAWDGWGRDVAEYLCPIGLSWLLAGAFAAAWWFDSRDPRVSAVEAVAMLAAAVVPALVGAAVVTCLALGGLRDESRRRRAAHGRWAGGRAAENSAPGEFSPRPDAP